MNQLSAYTLSLTKRWPDQIYFEIEESGCTTCSIFRQAERAEMASNESINQLLRKDEKYTFVNQLAHVMELEEKLSSKALLQTTSPKIKLVDKPEKSPDFYFSSDDDDDFHTVNNDLISDDDDHTVIIQDPSVEEIKDQAEEDLKPELIENNTTVCKNR